MKGWEACRPAIDAGRKGVWAMFENAIRWLITLLSVFWQLLWGWSSNPAVLVWQG
jgi:hypothetical protein